MKKFNKEFKNIWDFLILLLELAVPVLLAYLSTKEAGIYYLALSIAAGILATNVLWKLFKATRQ